MNGIAFFMDNSSISYSAIYVVLGTVTALAISLLTALLYRHRMTPVMATAALSMITALFCSRAVYWYCCPEQFDGFGSAMVSFGSGGFSLVGVIVGVLLAAVIVRITRIGDDLPALLDCLAPGAAVGIAIGRLGGFFSADDKGNFIFTDSAFQRLPFSVPVQDSITGSVEWRFASFFWESMAGFAIFAALLVMILLQPANDTRRRGDLFMAFISMFGATQATLESTRYDALHMRSNGFISMMQLTALLMLLTPLVYYTVKAVRAKVPVGALIIFCSVSAASLAGAAVAEYFVQRKARLAMTIYPVQFALLLLACVMTLLIAMRANKAQAENAGNPA